MKKNIGIKAKEPKDKCEDVNCPFHGSLKVKQVTAVGTVISSKMQKTVTIEIPRTHFIPKFERYEKRRTKIKAHNPHCLNVKEGDIVKVALCKPLAKNKNYVVIEKNNHKDIAEKEEKYQAVENKKEESDKE